MDHVGGVRPHPIQFPQQLKALAVVPHDADAQHLGAQGAEVVGDGAPHPGGEMLAVDLIGTHPRLRGGLVPGGIDIEVLV